VPPSGATSVSIVNARSSALAIAALLVVAGAGCAGKASRPAASPAPQPVAPCVGADEQRSGGFTNRHGGGQPVSGVVLGTGDTGVVLANQSDGDLCQWQPYGEKLARAGYRVALFNYSGQGSPTDVLSALDALRAKGAKRVFLIGASMGGTAVLATATQAQPAVAGVVDLSGPESSGGADALAAVRTLSVPVLFIAGQYDTPFVDDTNAMYTACASTDKKLSVEPGGNHGVALLNDHVTGLIQAFLKGH
jgi:pimeloyl-ACP methyl ester carboxylesterase